MRKLLYISIAISLAILIVSIAHHQWRIQNLRDELVNAQDTTGAVPTVASKPATVAQPPSENNAAAPDAHGITEQQRKELRALLAEYERQSAAFDNVDDKYERSERSLALSREIEAVEAEIPGLMATIERLYREHPETDIYVPPAAVAAMEAALTDDAYDRTIAKFGSLDNFYTYIAKTYLDLSLPPELTGSGVGSSE